MPKPHSKIEEWKSGFHEVTRDSKGHLLSVKKIESPPPPPPPPPPPTVFEKEKPSEKIGKSGFRYKITVKIILSRTITLKRGERLDYYYMSLTSNSKQLSWSQRQRIEEYVRSRKENIYKDARIVDVIIVRIIDRVTGEKWLYE
jgi:hypothetical protein